MNGNDLKDIYQSTSYDLRSSWFHDLSVEEKKLLFNSLNYGEQNQLLESLSLSYVKEFINSYDGRDRRNLYRRLSENQLKAIYNTINEDEKKEMAGLLKEIRGDLLESIQQKQDNIQQASKEINNNNNQIQESTVHLANAEIMLQNQKQQLKENKIKLKKLDKERKKKIKQVLKSSKPSILNRVGIISKRRTAKLRSRIQELELTNQEISSLQDYNTVVRQSIQNQQNIIEREKKSIQQSKENINLSKKTIHCNVKRIGDIEVKIRQASQTEKKVIGRKLYRQQLNMGDCFVSKRNNSKQLNQQKQVSSIQIQETNVQNQPLTDLQFTNINPISVDYQTSSKEKKQPIVVDTQQSVYNLLNIMDELEKISVDFTNDFSDIQTVSPDINLSNQIADLNKEQKITMSYAIPIITDYKRKLKNQKMQMQQTEDLGRSRVLQKSSGVVSLALLLSMVLFIFSLFLFFIL